MLIKRNDKVYRYAGSVEASLDTDEPQNLLLRSLHEADLDRLRPFLELVPLVPRRILQHARMPIEHLYFIEDGLVSVQATTGEQEPVEVWLIGPEGVVGSSALLGVTASPLRHVVHIGGQAYRVAVDDVIMLAATMPQLRTAILNYLHAALMQSSQSAACGLRHTFPQRLARWLLTVQDRTARDEFPITQDLLARTLGVRRATVSETIGSLEGKGVLARLRGRIRIRNRAMLEQIACRCYRILRREQERRLRLPADHSSLFALQAICCFV
jgi:CRP-like cAMP-binding protein